MRHGGRRRFATTPDRSSERRGATAEPAAGRTIGTGKAGYCPIRAEAAQDWITLWQSELSAMAADPEMRESWQTAMALWAGTMAAVVRGLPRAAPAERSGAFATDDRPAGSAGPADAPRTAAAAAAPDARDAEIERLARHVAALERRLAELERRRSSSPSKAPSAATEASEPVNFPAAVVAETLRQDAALIDGIAAYRRHPWHRTLLGPAGGLVRRRHPPARLRSSPPASRFCSSPA